MKHFLVLNIPNHVDGFCDIPNSNTYTRKCAHVFPWGHKLIDQNNQGLLFVTLYDHYKMIGHFQFFEIGNKIKKSTHGKILIQKFVNHLVVAL